MRDGIAKTARLYYLVLAVCDIGTLAVTHFLNFFLDHGLHFITDRQFYLQWATHYIWGCHIIRGSWYFFPHMVNWTMFLLNFERVCVVMFPLRARKWFSIYSNLYYLLFIVLIGAGIAALMGKVSNIFSTDILGSDECLIDKTDSWFVEYMILLVIDMYLLPNSLSLLCAIILIVKAKGELNKRSQLTHNLGLINNNNASNMNHKRTNSSGTLAQIPGAIVAVSIAFVHATFYLPNAFFVTVFYLTLGSLDVVVSAEMWTLFITFMVLTSTPSLINFIIYFIRIPEFKEKLNCCSHSSANI